MRRRDRFSASSATLLQRTQQWFAARERLLSAWFARAHSRTRERGAALRRRLGGAGAILLPNWWEYESPLMRQLALEAVLRRMFAMVPKFGPQNHALP